MICIAIYLILFKFNIYVLLFVCLLLFCLFFVFVGDCFLFVFLLFGLVCFVRVGVFWGGFGFFLMKAECMNYFNDLY